MLEAQPRLLLITLSVLDVNAMCFYGNVRYLFAWKVLQPVGLSRMCSNSSRSYYSLLELNRNATKAEIKSSFLRLSKRHHPDLNPSSKSEDAHKKFRAINEAYLTLKDPARRSAYDLKLYGPSDPQFDTAPSGLDEERFGFYKYNPHTNAYAYARAYEYYDLNDAEWKELYRRSGASRPRKDHFRVIRLLVLLMLSGTLLHGARIYFTHRNYWFKSEAESRKNQELYEAVRERGRRSSLRQQTDRLVHAQDQNCKLGVARTRRRD